MYGEAYKQKMSEEPLLAGEVTPQNILPFTYTTERHRSDYKYSMKKYSWLQMLQITKLEDSWVLLLDLNIKNAWVK
jgi:hypothetical protein